MFGFARVIPPLTAYWGVHGTEALGLNWSVPTHSRYTQDAQSEGNALRSRKAKGTPCVPVARTFWKYTQDAKAKGTPCVPVTRTFWKDIFMSNHCYVWFDRIFLCKTTATFGLPHLVVRGSLECGWDEEIFWSTHTFQEIKQQQQKPTSNSLTTARDLEKRNNG